MSCIFCNIIDGVIPSYKVYEDEDVLAILDISQITKGHTIVLPKKHFDNLLEINNEYYLKVMHAVKMIADQIVKNLHAVGCNIINNCNSVAGQTVMHFHIHIIPRYTENELRFEHADNTNIFDLEEIKKEILAK